MLALYDLRYCAENPHPVDNHQGYDAPSPGTLLYEVKEAAHEGAIVLITELQLAGQDTRKDAKNDHNNLIL